MIAEYYMLHSLLLEHEIHGKVLMLTTLSRVSGSSFEMREGIRICNPNVFPYMKKQLYTNHLRRRG